jgi:glycosyltransferase involved in cell wall biosynthesis
MPVVTTLHTVLSQPSRVQRAVIDRIVAVSSRVVVMAEKGRELLQKVYDVPADKIEVIPHGIPDIAFAEPEEAKARFGFTGKAVILTFGLLSPNKGIEYVIDAMPAILTPSFRCSLAMAQLDRGRVKTRRNFANDRAEQDFSRFFRL